MVYKMEQNTEIDIFGRKFKLKNIRGISYSDGLHHGLTIYVRHHGLTIHVRHDDCIYENVTVYCQYWSHAESKKLEVEQMVKTYRKISKTLNIEKREIIIDRIAKVSRTGKTLVIHGKKGYIEIEEIECRSEKIALWWYLKIGNILEDPSKVTWAPDIKPPKEEASKKMYIELNTKESDILDIHDIHNIWKKDVVTSKNIKHWQIKWTGKNNINGGMLSYENESDRNADLQKIKKKLNKPSITDKLNNPRRQNMIEKVKEQYKKHEDVLFPLLVLMALDYFFNDGRFQKKIAAVVEGILDKVTNKFASKDEKAND